MILARARASLEYVKDRQMFQLVSIDVAQVQLRFLTCSTESL